jgi:hydroxymethylpyrimidine pyrophosphatase-like HAD family hydrolase
LGKPFESELATLPETYSWALATPIKSLARGVERLFPYPLLAVGSGGSFSACHFIAHLHGEFARQSAVPMSPLQAVAGNVPSASMGVIIPTAGGSNPDVIAAVRLLAEQEPQGLLVLCGNPESRVAAIAARNRLIDFVAFELPAGRDGFLATNSLIAFCVLMGRAYCEVAGQKPKLPKEFGGLLRDKRLLRRTDFRDSQLLPVLSRQTVVVLHGPSTVAAAVDLESKFTEAALGQVQVCDYRQFAHGRHHWLAKRPNDTAILSIESIDDQAIAEQTLSILPENIPIERIKVRHSGWMADLSGICEALFVTDVAGRVLGIDPGRPGVPPFGRELYHANAFSRRDGNSTRQSNQLANWQAKAIERKAQTTIGQLQLENRLHFWQSSLAKTLERLTADRFCGLVVDYDGTLCNEDERFDPLPKDIVDALLNLLSAGMMLGVATGRGKSVRERLQEAIPKKHWAQVVVGYYNGGQLARLSEDVVPDGRDRVSPELEVIADALQKDGLLRQSEITLRERQITLNKVRGLTLSALCEHAEAIVNRVAGDQVRVMRSGHSVDVVPQVVSKLAVVRCVRELAQAPEDAPVLRIGDRGRWPGNDAQMLASPHGLSAFEVSSDPSTCWNLAIPGMRGRQATLRYLTQLKVGRGGLRLKLAPIAGGEQ